MVEEAESLRQGGEKFRDSATGRDKTWCETAATFRSHVRKIFWH